MISMATFEDLRAQNHSLAVYCIDCNRWESVDIEALIARGLGARELTRTRFRCRDCGGIAEKQLRPPVPEVTAAVAYIGARSPA